MSKKILVLGGSYFAGRVFVMVASQRGYELTVVNLSLIHISSDRVNVEAAFTRHGILSYFQEILTCSEMHTDKTKPDIFLEAARRLQAAPADILVFEDVLHALKTAGKAGFQTAAVFDRYSAGQEKEIRETADYYLKTFKEFSTCAAKCTVRSEQ